MQGQEQKKQFSLSLITRIFLGLLVVLAICIFANSIMEYNELMKQKRELESILDAHEDLKAELQELLDEDEPDYDTIIRIAKEYLNLHFPDEEIYYNDLIIFAKAVFSANLQVSKNSSSVSPAKPTIISVVNVLSGIYFLSKFIISRYSPEVYLLFILSNVSSHPL